MPSAVSSIARASLIFQWLLMASTPAVSANLFSDSGEASGALSPLREKESRIINGDEALEDRYPYSLTLQDGSGHFCGGSLIGNDLVLTAAHCMGGGFAVRIGSDDKDEGELIGTRRIVVHPDYDSNTDEWDMALVFLERSTSLPVPLVRINDDSSYPPAGTYVVTMGWGDTDEDEDNLELPDNLHEVDLRVITNDECETIEIDGESYRNWIYDNMLCTYTKGKDACQGDSGGPLVVAGDSPQDDIQVGIVSWGVGCANLPGVFSRISEAYDWMVETVCDEDDGSNDPPPSLCSAESIVITPGPTNFPTREPTRDPTRNPTRNPTRVPTQNPTQNPTRQPTRQPTINPTQQPTKEPTMQPTQKPTNKPTSSPTTLEPTSSPTEQPTDSPSISSAPTSSPSASPTTTSMPTAPPTDTPSLSSAPSITPSAPPTISVQPSSQPTAQPTSDPTAQPSEQPSVKPSSQPSIPPSASSSLRPSLSSSPTTSASPSTEPSLTSSFSPSDSPTLTSSPTKSSSPTLSVSPTVKPESGRTIPGDSLLIADASDGASASAVDDKSKNSSSGMGRTFAIETVLLCVISAWTVL